MSQNADYERLDTRLARFALERRIRRFNYRPRDEKPWKVWPNVGEMMRLSDIEAAAYARSLLGHRPAHIDSSGT